MLSSRPVTRGGTEQPSYPHKAAGMTSAQEFSVPTTAANRMHISLGLTLQTGKRVKNSVTREVPPDINFTTRDELGIKIRRRNTRNGHNTHLVFDPCLGPNRSGAGQAASPAWAASEVGGTEVLGRGTQHSHRRALGAQGQKGRGTVSSLGGAGAGSPQSSLL